MPRRIEKKTVVFESKFESCEACGVENQVWRFGNKPYRCYNCMLRECQDCKQQCMTKDLTENYGDAFSDYARWLCPECWVVDYINNLKVRFDELDSLYTQYFPNIKERVGRFVKEYFDNASL